MADYAGAIQEWGGTLNLTVFAPDGKRIEYFDARIEDTLYPDLVFKGRNEHGDSVRVMTTLPFLTEVKLGHGTSTADNDGCEQLGGLCVPPGKTQ